MKLILKSIVIEAFVIFTYVFLINNYIGNVETTIHADGIGYYDYLPSIFIHHDLVRNDIPLREDSGAYSRINALGVYVESGNYKVDRYPVGTAILQLPFFLYTYLTTDLEGEPEDGYQSPFQKTIFHAALFYLFLSIIFLRKTLEQYETKKYAIVFAQVLLVLATSVTHYANVDAGFSHVYSLFAITAFLYYVRSYFNERDLSDFLWASLFFGLIILLRQINFLVILFIPFLAGSVNNLKEGIVKLFEHSKKLTFGILIVLGMLFIQSLLWYLQAGSFFVYSYPGHTFDFTNPEFFNILFSYRKGLFIYTPILFLGLISVLWLGIKGKPYFALTWMSFFVILTYVLSSWSSWYYGSSYGLRAYIDYYAIFIIPLALLLDRIAIGIKLIVLSLSLLTVPFNIIQTYQYRMYILHWFEMDSYKYWTVFLKTEDRFKGLVWKRKYDGSQFQTIKEISVGDISTSKDKTTLIYSIESSEIPQFEDVVMIQVLIDNDYRESNDSKIVMSINESEGNYNYYWHNIHFIHYMETKFDENQTGLYNYEITPILDGKEKTIRLQLSAGKQDNSLRNVKLKFLKRN
ncbi:MAG TPA: hypothetical protein EYN51_00155 [Flavobacteriales bacterium]|nr:hypothetical protein [Flavobacteriales bacterium]HIA11052.1 hypothetical protein [Flavobacteriales bacterium]